MIDDIIKKNGKIIKHIFLIIMLGLFLSSPFFISFFAIGNQENKSYPTVLEMIIHDIKKKVLKCEMVALETVKVWNQKSPEDKMFEQLNSDGGVSGEVYNQGCGGGEIFLE